MLKRLHIRQFLAVVDSGNFSRAAQRINVTQPTLSSGIADLELLMGARLFIRERRHARLTAAGSNFLVMARAIENDFKLAEGLLGSIATPEPAIRFAMLASVPTQLYFDIAGSLDGKTSLELFEGNEADIRKRFAQGKLDLAITILRPEDEQQNALALFDEPYQLFLPEGHALATKDAIDISEIAGEIMIARRSCELLQETSRFFTQRGVRPLFSFKSTNDDRCIEMVKAGMGITTAPASLARPGVVCAQLIEYNYRRSIGLVFSREWLAQHGLDHPLVSLCQKASQTVYR